MGFRKEGLQILHAESLEELEASTEASSISFLTWSPDGERIATAGTRSLKLWQTEDLKLLLNHSMTSRCQGVEFIDGGRALIYAHAGGEIRLAQAWVPLSQ